MVRLFCYITCMPEKLVMMNTKLRKGKLYYFGTWTNIRNRFWENLPKNKKDVKVLPRKGKTKDTAELIPKQKNLGNKIHKKLCLWCFDLVSITQEFFYWSFWFFVEDFRTRFLFPRKHVSFLIQPTSDCKIQYLLLQKIFFQGSWFSL